MMLAKMATPGPLKIKVFEKKAYEVIISVHDVINKVSSRRSTYSVNVAL